MHKPFAHVHLGRDISIPHVIHPTGHTKETHLIAKYAFSIQKLMEVQIFLLVG